MKSVKAMVPGTYCEVYGTGILILKYMVQGYLLRSLWFRGTYCKVYGTGVLILKYPTGTGVFISKYRDTYRVPGYLL